MMGSFFPYTVAGRRNISHFSVLTSKPRVLAALRILSKSSSTVSGLSPMVPSSRYQQLYWLLQSLTKSWIASANWNGPSGSPCWTPSCEGIMSPLKYRLDGWL